MLLLITYILIALVFSFLCSIAEAVILSVTPTYIAMAKDDAKWGSQQLADVKENINRTLAAILTLNTIAHTLGAAGAGAQATRLFGEAYLGIASAILTLLILIFSEIIPKTLGATYWRKLAPITAVLLKGLIWILYPLVILSELITRQFSKGHGSNGFSRSEIMVMADLSHKEGTLAEQESEIIKNLLKFQEVRLKDIMTPRTVIFSLSETATVGFFFHRHDNIRFSRIPLYSGKSEHITGFVLRSDLLLAQARGNSNNNLSVYQRPISSIPETVNLAKTFNELIKDKTQIIRVIDEYGSTRGIVTLEDILETLIGLEIVDEGDTVSDMRLMAHKLWQKRIQKLERSVNSEPDV